MSKFMKLATQAAELEREQCYYQAEELWRQALVRSYRADNQAWCRARAEFCSHARRWTERGQVPQVA